MLSSIKPTEVSAETISLLKSLPTAFITDQLYKKLVLRYRAIGFALCFAKESSGKTLSIDLAEFSTQFNMY
jgi:hypothetical protein